MNNTNPCLIPNGKLIVFNYPAGAGGKMLQNCIGLSRHCVLSQLEWAQWQYDWTGDFTKDFYQQKLDWMLSTLTPRHKLNRWQAYELGDGRIFGVGFKGWKEKTIVPHDLIYQLGKKELWCTTTVHNFGSVDYLLDYWPEIKHVSLVNNEKFSRMSIVKKKLNVPYDDEWNTLGITDPTIAFNFDIDSTIYSKLRFWLQVQDLYDYLGFDDFQKDMIIEYHTRYIELHL
jgi:hypothetical protein